MSAPYDAYLITLLRAHDTIPALTALPRHPFYIHVVSLLLILLPLLFHLVNIYSCRHRRRCPCLFEPALAPPLAAIVDPLPGLALVWSARLLRSVLLKRAGMWAGLAGGLGVGPFSADAFCG